MLSFFDCIRANLEKEMAYWEDATMQYEEAEGK
jgi:hypothetical protein